MKMEIVDVFDELACIRSYEFPNKRNGQFYVHFRWKTFSEIDMVIMLSVDMETKHLFTSKY